MSKLDLITIAIVIVCLAALGYLVYKIVDLMNPPQEETIAIEDTYSDTLASDSTYTDWDDEVASVTENDDDLDDADLESGTTDADLDKASYDEEEMDIEEAAPNSIEADDSGTTATSYESTNSADAGEYMEIAGSYRQKINAENQAAKLRNLGYSSSQVASFNRGSYAVVLVDRFSSYGDAKTLVSKLAGDGVEAMIKEKH